MRVNVVKKEKRSRTSKKSKRRMIILGTFSFVAITFTTYTIGKYWIEIYQKSKEKEKLTAELKKLEKKESSLRADATRMKDKEYIARYAREKYLYSKNGEFILRIP